MEIFLHFDETYFASKATSKERVYTFLFDLRPTAKKTPAHSQALEFWGIPHLCTNRQHMKKLLKLKFFFTFQEFKHSSVFPKKGAWLVRLVFPWHQIFCFAYVNPLFEITTLRWKDDWNAQKSLRIFWDFFVLEISILDVYGTGSHRHFWNLRPEFGFPENQCN